MRRRSLIFTLFPYTTLFRSRKKLFEVNAMIFFGWCLCTQTAAFFNWTFSRSEEHTSELQSRGHLVCRLLLEKKKVNGTWITQRRVSGRERNSYQHRPYHDDY